MANKKMSFEQRMARLKEASVTPLAAELRLADVPMPAAEVAPQPARWPLSHHSELASGSRILMTCTVAFLVLAAVAAATLVTSDNAFIALSEWNVDTTWEGDVTLQ